MLQEKFCSLDIQFPEGAAARGPHCPLWAAPSSPYTVAGPRLSGSPLPSLGQVPAKGNGWLAVVAPPRGGGGAGTSQPKLTSFPLPSMGARKCLQEVLHFLIYLALKLS